MPEKNMLMFLSADAIMMLTVFAAFAYLRLPAPDLPAGGIGVWLETHHAHRISEQEILVKGGEAIRGRGHLRGVAGDRFHVRLAGFGGFRRTL